MNRLNVTFHDLPFAVEEALNRLRVNIKFCGKNIHKILVTSSIPNEGKSFVSLHLWKMLAEAGFKTVFLDLDLRNSRVNERHELKAEGELKGIDYYLSGNAEYEEVIYNTNIPNGDMIPIANILENPSTLLEDPRFAELLKRLSNDYRYVIIDSPPLVNVTDGALVAALCDGAVMVVRSGFTSKKLIRQSLQQLERVQCKLLGVVLNRVPYTAERKYGKYGKYGQYGRYGQYGYGYGRKSKSVRTEKK